MDITVTELKEKLDKGDEFVFIDVREDYEYDEFNIGGKLIPLGDLMFEVDNLEEHKEDEIVVMCRTGNRSGQAQAILEMHGFSNVRNLEGGILAWSDKFESNTTL